MAYRQKLWIIFILPLAILISGCVGYERKGGPYPYSHVNNQNASPAPTNKPRPPKRTVKSTAIVRDKPKPPVRNVSVSNVQTPAQQQITIKKGDTVYALSRKHSVSVRSIITMNKLKAPYLLKPGQKINIAKGSTYVVRKGDTVYGVSRKNGVLMNDLVKMNDLKSPYALRIGQSLNLPDKRAGLVVANNNIPSPPRTSGKGFMWPVKGNVVSGYGPKSAGYHNDGVNISAPRGSSVHASESGVVVHASNKLKGYGNLILIKHQNGWVTAYAHNDKLLVTKGQRVERGQVVAQVGQTGRVSKPQLHFEMRKGARTVNPVHYLKG